VKIFDIGCFGIVVRVSEGGGSIRSDLHDLDTLKEEDRAKLQWEDSVNAIESLILAHACAGIDIATPAYLEGIETAVETCSNQIE